MGEEQVQGVDRFATGGFGADDVLQPHVRIARAQQDVRRLAGTEERDEDEAHQREQEPDRDGHRGIVADDVRQTEADRIAAHLAVPDVQERHAEHDQELAQALLTHLFALLARVDLLSPDQFAVLEFADVHSVPPVAVCVCRSRVCGRHLSTDLT